MDWSLLGCGRHGHVTYAPDEAELRTQMSVSLGADQAWQCLRCGAYVRGPAAGHGPAAQAPVVRRGREIRSVLILRFFALERILRALIFLVAAYVLWHYRHSQKSLQHAFDRDLSSLHGILGQFGYNINHSKLVGLLRDALTLSTHTITLLAIGALAYAIVELVEAVGLWTARRWGEYFAMIITSVGLPLEIYDLTRKVTVTTIVLLIINLALVLYLAITKRLFGIRGGKRAYDERLREESVLEAARRERDLGQVGTGPAAAVAAAAGATSTTAGSAEPGGATATAAAKAVGPQAAGR